MNKVNRTKKYNFVYSLLLIAIIGFGATTLAMPQKASALSFTSQGAKCAYNAAPVIYAINPDPVNAKSGVIIVNIIGNNFVTGSVARFNNDDRVTAYISPTSLYVSLLSNDTFSAGDNTVTVFTPSPGGGVSNTVIFKVNDTTLPIAPATSVNTNNNNTSSGFFGGKTTTTTPTPTPSTNTTPTNNTTSASTNQGALAVNASGGNFAWNALTWILLSTLILVVVILWRKYYLMRKKMEGTETPLKHA